jgi:hypothetical protein
MFAIVIDELRYQDIRAIHIGIGELYGLQRAKTKNRILVETMFLLIQVGRRLPRLSSRSKWLQQWGKRAYCSPFDRV